MSASDYIHYQLGGLKEQGNGSELLSANDPSPVERGLPLGHVVVPQIYYTHESETVRVRTI